MPILSHENVAAREADADDVKVLEASKLYSDVLLQNVGLVIAGFAKDNTNCTSSRQLAFVIRRYYQSAHPILVVVTGNKRGNRIKQFLENFLESKAEKKRKQDNNQDSLQVVIVQDNIAAALERGKVAIASASILQNELSAGRLHWRMVKFLILDEAQKCNAENSEMTLFMKDHYHLPDGVSRNDSPNFLPRVVAIVTASKDDIPFASIEKKLSVRFQNSGRRTTIWKSKPSYTVDAYPATIVVYDVPNVSSMFGGGEATSQRAFLEAELGHAAVSIYQNWFYCLRKDIKGSCSSVSDPVMGVNLSHKALLLLGIVMEAYREARHNLSVIIYAGAPYIAVTLGELFSSYPVFKDLKTRVLFGDRYYAASFADNGRPIRVQDEEEDTLVADAFSLGDVNLLIVASVNMERIRKQFPLSPAPLIIDFEGNNIDYDPPTDVDIAAGGVCKAIVFRQKKDPSGRRDNRRRKRPRAEGTENGVVRTGIAEPWVKKQRREAEGASVPVHFQKVADALLGPSCYKTEEESHLYGVVFPEEKEQIGPFDFNCIRYRSRFGIILSKKLRDEDLELHLRNFYRAIKLGVKPIRLEYLGSFVLSKEDLELFQKYTRDMFSAIFPRERNDLLNFKWGINTFSEGSSTAGRTMEFLMNYLVVSLRLFNIAGAGAKANIDFGKMKMIHDLKMRTANMNPPTGMVKLMVHTDSLEGSMVYDGRAKTPVLAGYVQHNKSPLDKVKRSKKFMLNDDGSLKDDDDIKHLVNVKYEPDEKTTRHPDLPDPVDLETAVLFSPLRNRMKKRAYWTGLIHSTPEIFVHKSFKKNVNALHQPLISVIDTPQMSLAKFCQVLEGAPIHTVACDIVEEITSPRPKYDHMKVPETLRMHPIFTTEAMLLPNLLNNLEQHVLLCELREKVRENNKVDVSIPLLYEAVTSFPVNQKFNYERLELLGDSVLDLSATVHIFAENPHAKEGQMHDLRKNLVNNKKLGSIAEKENIVKYLNFNVRKVETWLPPGTHREGTSVTLNEKSLADVTEALCGALFLSGFDHGITDPMEKSDTKIKPRYLCPKRIVSGYKAGGRFLEWLGVFECAEPSANSILRASKRTLVGPKKKNCDRFPEDPRVKEEWERTGKNVEEILGYHFKNRELLFLALTSKSYAQEQNMSNQHIGFQRLEFLGDAIAGFVVVAYLYEQFPELGPGSLTELKGACVSNETFARVAVKKKLDTFYYVESNSLIAEIQQFKKAISPKHASRKESSEVGAPKPLGDLFEACLGAIYVDSGLEEAFRVAMDLLEDTFATKADPNKADLLPSVQLLEQIRAMGFHDVTLTPKHSKESNRFVCKISMLTQVIGTGKGTNKDRAKYNAYKEALRRINNKGLESTWPEQLKRLRMIHASRKPTANRTDG